MNYSYAAAWLGAILTAALVCNPSTGFPKAPPFRLLSGPSIDPLCTAEWSFSRCVPINNKCGAGYMLGARSGELCRVLTELFSCTAPCVEEDGVVHVDALFDRPKRGPHNKDFSKHVESSRSSTTKGRHSAVERKDSKNDIDYRAHSEGAQYVQDGCSYKVGRWQNCSVVNLNRKREDQLLAHGDSGSICSEKKYITMDCSLDEINGKSSGCRYSYGGWSKCDQNMNTRVQRQTLIYGNSEKCSPEISLKKPCYNKNGKERCFYGRWTQWTACVNNIKTRHREVLFGGERCVDRAIMKTYCAPP